MLLSERCWPREMKVPHNKQFTEMSQIDCQQFTAAILRMKSTLVCMLGCQVAFNCHNCLGIEAGGRRKYGGGGNKLTNKLYTTTMVRK